MYSGHPDWAIEREGKHVFPGRPVTREQLRALEAALRQINAAPAAPPLVATDRRSA